MTKARVPNDFNKGEFVDKILLTMIFVPYAGPDALPFDQIKKRNIRIANVHGNAPYVAERAVAMALGFYGKIIDYQNDLKNYDGTATGPPEKLRIPGTPYNVVLSPHLAGFTPQAARHDIAQTVENIRSYLKTGKALFEVDPETMY